MRFHRRTPRNVARTAGSWLPLVLLLVVLVPSVGLLWFMNRAAQNEQLAVRQKLSVTYRVYLVLAQERLQTHWQQFVQELDTGSENRDAPALFARVVGDNRAEALVGFDAAGHTTYPKRAATPPPPEKPDHAWAEARRLESADPAAAAAAYAHLAAHATADDAAARALQAQSRCLVRAGDKAAALALLTGPLAAERYRHSIDAQGRLIQPNAKLMALELAPEVAPAQVESLRARLESLVLNYDDSALTSPQRRFLLRELLKLSPDSEPSPAGLLLAAEDLAAQWLAADSAVPREPLLRASAVPGIWQLSSRNGRIVTLHQTENLLTRLNAALAMPDLPADVRVEFFAPGREIEDSLLSLPAGPVMPGWRLALPLQDQQLLDTTSRQSADYYLWIGGLVVCTAILLALLTWELLRRQIALTRLRNDLVANVTHELKTPLSSMRLFVETLLHSPQLNAQTTREYLQLIAQENLRLSRLIDNFLTFSRIERNKYTYTFRPVPASSLAENAAAAVRERLQVPGCHFTTAIPPDLPCVSADADALITALINLLDNAFKYSGETKEIALTAGTRAGAVFFAVRDNGVGLSPRDAKRIFQRFYQVNPQRSPANGGCGLGLSIVHAIITSHRGTIHIDSQPGHGSTFTITLPSTHP